MNEGASTSAPLAASVAGAALFKLSFSPDSDPSSEQCMPRTDHGRAAFFSFTIHVSRSPDRVS